MWRPSFITLRSFTKVSKKLNNVNGNKSCLLAFRSFRDAPAVRSDVNTPQKKIEPIKWILFSVPVITFGLGTWQVQRRKWKLQLIEDLKKKTSAPPVDLPEDLEELKEMEYCPIHVEGQFDHSRELYMGPRSLIIEGDSTSQGGLISQGGHSGYLVVTPFRLADRDMTILVNRGWVPKNAKNPNTRKGAQIEGEIELTGIVRLTEKRAPLGPKNQPNIWFYRDLEAMAKTLGTEPVYIEATIDSTVPGGPIGGQTRVTMRNEHLSYLLTWYGLSAATAYMWFRFFIQKQRLL